MRSNSFEQFIVRLGTSNDSWDAISLKNLLNQNKTVNDVWILYKKSVAELPMNVIKIVWGLWGAGEKLVISIGVANPLSELKTKWVIFFVKKKSAHSL